MRPVPAAYLRTCALLASVALAACGLTISDAQPAGARSGTVLAAAIGARPAVRQMVTVSSAGFASTTGTLKAWRRGAGGTWVRVRGPVRVVLGYGGWVVADRRRQNTGTTPAGRFRLPATFGRLPDPGTHVKYRRVDGNDWWPYEPRDPATYNVYQQHRTAQTHWRRTFAEHLDDYTKQYAYAAEVGFNLPGGVHYSRSRHQWVARRPADTRRGGGIFLHVKGDGLTAGCVAMSRSSMRWLLTWIRPEAHPRLVMGPHDYIVRH